MSPPTPVETVAKREEANATMAVAQEPATPLTKRRVPLNPAQKAELAYQRRAWLHGWAELRSLIEQEGGLQVGATKEEIVEKMRQTRYEIFEAEYAHLYR